MAERVITSVETKVPATAIRVVDQWLDAFSASNVEAIVALYAPDAVFIGTESQTLVTQPSGIRQYFEKALSNRTRSARMLTTSVLQVSADVVLVAGLNEVGELVDGVWRHRVGRLTLVLSGKGDHWSIIHFHRSRLPD